MLQVCGIVKRQTRARRVGMLQVWGIVKRRIRARRVGHVAGVGYCKKTDQSQEGWACCRCGVL